MWTSRNTYLLDLQRFRLIRFETDTFLRSYLRPVCYFLLRIKAFIFSLFLDGVGETYFLLQGWLLVLWFQFRMSIFVCVAGVISIGIYRLCLDNRRGHSSYRCGNVVLAWCGLGKWWVWWESFSRERSGLLFNSTFKLPGFFVTEVLAECSIYSFYSIKFFGGLKSFRK